MLSFIVVVANNYACIGLDKIEERLPILNQPTDKVSSFHLCMLSRRTINTSFLLSLKFKRDTFQKALPEAQLGSNEKVKD